MWLRGGTTIFTPTLGSIKAAGARHAPPWHVAVGYIHHRGLCSGVYRSSSSGGSSKCSSSQKDTRGPAKASGLDGSNGSGNNDDSAAAAPAGAASRSNTTSPSSNTTAAEPTIVEGSPLPAAVGEGSNKPAAPNWGFAPIPFVASGRTMPGQRLLPCTREDAEILAKGEAKYPSPQEVEGGIVVRIIAAKDAQKVTSPVLRVVRNRQYGIRKGERLRLALGGAFFSSVLAALGFWQLRRMHAKQELIEYRRSHLARQPTVITASPFPWTLQAAEYTSQRASKEKEGPAAEDSSSTAAAVQSEKQGSDSPASQASPAPLPAPSSAATECIPSDSSAAPPGHSAVAAAQQQQQQQQQQQPAREAGGAARRTQRSGRLLADAAPEDVERAVREWAYTPVVLHGVLDSTTELFVGPRPGLEVGNPGYCVVSPLRLQDGSVILVNKGHLPLRLARLPPFPGAVNEEDEPLVALQRRALEQQRAAAEEQQLDEQLETMQQQQQRGKHKYVNLGAQQYMERLQQAAGSRTEPVGYVTVRGVLEPGEVANSSFKALMLKNRPHEGQFNVVNPGDLVEATPAIPNKREAALLMVNAYSIVYDEDVLHPQQTEAGGQLKVANRFMSYEQKKKDDYLLFYADEHTHFNYACQWFLMGLCTAAMTVYKIIEVSKWRW
ncbi:hypothetical protein, conserved [Eimeria brunetti]|uniref:SURF1-like protein n=1 Tax=Eimeria brunetti TaxID=51314 RepID=U6LVU6_9EIME|nr:hypothetical protein, conserved [Eimeria brunetti]